MQPKREAPSLGDLFADLSRQMTTLVRQEINLATTEMTHKATRVGKDIGFLAVGGAVAYAGLLAIIAAAIFALVDVFHWASSVSALIVGLVVAVIGYVLVKRGMDALTREDLAPRQTIDTIKENAEWAKEQTR